MRTTGQWLAVTRVPIQSTESYNYFACAHTSAQRAALVVCSRADDRESARLLLDALGLLDDPSITRRAS